jgi:D-threo-aldose 1-dehydrogenase
MDVVSDASAHDAVHAALDAGITYFDTSPFYGLGLSEHRLGAALRARPDAPVVISTKVGRLLRPAREALEPGLFKGALPFRPEFDYSYDGAMRSIEDSLQRLGRSSIDIVHIHDVSPNMQGDMLEQRYREAASGAARALFDLRDQGVVRAVGVAVSDWRICLRFAQEVGRFDLFLLACRYTLLDQEPARDFLPFCRNQGIGVIAAAPFVSGILATGAVPGAKYMYAPADAAILERTRQIEVVCARFDVPLQAAALQMALGDPAVVSVLPGFRAAWEVKAAVEMMQCPIPAAFWAALKADQLISEETLVPHLADRTEGAGR